MNDKGGILKCILVHKGNLGNLEVIYCQMNVAHILKFGVEQCYDFLAEPSN